MRVNNKQVVKITIILLIIISGIIILNQNKNKEDKLDEVILKNELNNKTFAMYKEEGDSYVPYNSNTFPEGYVLNLDKSKCIDNNGNELNDVLSYEYKEVTITSGNTTYCYLYFDELWKPDIYISDITMLGSKESNNDGYLILHDGLGEYVNSEYEAGDYSYRFTGNNPDNYICLDGSEEEGECDSKKLYRIIGWFPTSGALIEYQMKLIKSEYLTKDETENNLETSTISRETTYNNEYLARVDKTTDVTTFHWSGLSSINYNNWRMSELNKALNKENGIYLNSLSSYINQIEDTTWYIGGNNYNDIVKQQNMKLAYENELGKNKLQASDVECTKDSTAIVECTEELLYQKNKIGLMYVTEYGYASYPDNWSTSLLPGYSSTTNRSQNWLYNGVLEWLLSRTTGHLSSFKVGYDGYAGSDDASGSYRSIRPVLNLKSTAEIISGDGSKNTPWRIKIVN